MSNGITMVTGGAGFIGSSLCRRLVEAGEDVVCIDNFSSGEHAKIAGLVDTGRFRLVEGDVADAAVIEQFDEVGRIYNLAALASPVFYQADPVGTLKTCLFGIINVLELARRTGARLLQTSTSEIYGEPLVHPQPEDYRGNVSTTGVRSCYDEGKRAGEAALFAYRRQYGVDFRLVRIFNTYGPGMRSDDGRVVPNFIMQALAGEPLTVYGEGGQTRCFCYVDDMVDGLIAMMERDGFEGPVNLGNPDEITMLELAERVIALSGSSSQIAHLPLPPDDPTRRRPDASLAKEKLGWQARTPLDEGLLRTIDYFKGL